MRAAGLFLMCQLIFVPTAFSDIFGTVALRHIFYRGVSEPIGPITLSVAGNEFAGISPENPAYIRIGFDHGATLSETLVDLENTASVKTPIFLKAVLNSSDQNATINVPEDAISIVRWRAGENSFWIKINEDSSFWIQSGAAFQPPSVEHRISFTIGLTVAFMADLPPVAAGLANREFNARSDGAPASTELRVDMSQSDLLTSGDESLLNFDPGFFDAQTSGVATAEQIMPGNALPILYTGGFCIGLARERLGAISFIYPWISNNNQFESLLIANNYGPRPSEIVLMARRADGTELRVDEVIPPWGTFKAPASQLFAALGRGKGYCVEMQATEEETVNGRWITFNRTTESGGSPSQGNAVKWNVDTNAANELLDHSILFGYLPPSGDFFAAPVIVNAGPANADVTLYFFNLAGDLLLTDDLTVRGLEPLKPFTVLVSELAPDSGAELNIIAVSQTSRLTGAGFVFNGFGEPSIGNVQGIEFTPPSPNPKKMSP